MLGGASPLFTAEVMLKTVPVNVQPFKGRARGARGHARGDGDDGSGDEDDDDGDDGGGKAATRTTTRRRRKSEPPQPRPGSPRPERLANTAPAGNRS